MFPRQFRVEIDPGRITSSVWNEGRSNMNATSLELSNRLSITTSQVREAFVEMEKAIKELD